MDQWLPLTSLLSKHFCTSRIATLPLTSSFAKVQHSALFVKFGEQISVLRVGVSTNNHSTAHYEVYIKVFTTKLAIKYSPNKPIPNTVIFLPIKTPTTLLV